LHPLQHAGLSRRTADPLFTYLISLISRMLLERGVPVADVAELFGFGAREK